MVGAENVAAVSRALAACSPAPGPYMQPPVARERRLHARAYQLWLSLCGGRPCPRIGDLSPRDLADFATASVLVELGRAAGPSTIHFLGRGLIAEAGIVGDLPSVAGVPRGSLLGQLLRRLPAVRDHGGPIGFEAEFDGGAGIPTTYRGILLPFADDADEIAYVYGVISWQLVATNEVGIDIVAAVDAALTALPAETAPPAWEVAPYAPLLAPVAPLPLPQQLSAARTWVALTGADRLRREASFGAALSAMHDFVLAADAQPVAFAALLAEAGIAPGPTQARATLLVFGPDLPRAERARCAAVLAHARRLGLGTGQLGDMLTRYPGGAAAFAEAERRARRQSRGLIEAAMGRARAASTAPIGRIDFRPLDDEYFLLLGRRGVRGTDIVGAVPDAGGALAQHALRRFAGA